MTSNAVDVASATGTVGPWQFTPEAYGAKGDGGVASDVTSNSTATFTSATVAANAKVGQNIMINGANGNPGVPVLGTITAISGNTFTCSASAGNSVSGCQAVFATDDTAAINKAITAASNFAQGISGSGAGFGNYFAQVVFAPKIYGVATLTQQTSPVVYNTQLLVPYPNVNGQTRKLMIDLVGAGYNAPAQYWESLTPNLQGTAIVSFLTAPNATPNDGTFGNQSVIGGSTGSGAFTGGFMNTHLGLINLSVWCPAYTNIKAVDMSTIAGCLLDGYASNIFAPANNLAGATPSAHPYLSDFPSQALFTNSHGIGILWPLLGNNDDVVFRSIAVEGYEIGMQAIDHVTGQRYAGLYCDVILKIVNSALAHEVSIQSVSAEQYNGGLLVTGGGGTNTRLNITWDSEVAAPVYDISDSSGVATGMFRWYDNQLGRTAPAVTGAANVTVLNDRVALGHMATPPAVPASTVASAPVYRPAGVVIHTGVGVTVSAINIGATATGLTMAASSSLQLPPIGPGQTITMTYAGGTPTWDWWLS